MSNYGVKYNKKYISGENMNINITKDKTRILIRDKGKNIDEEKLNKYRIEKTEGGQLFVLEVGNKEEFIEKWNIIQTVSKNISEIEVLVLHDYDVTSEVAEDIYLGINNLFGSKFSYKGFYLSKIEYYVEKEYLYSVEIESNFAENLNIEIGRFVYQEDKIEVILNEINEIFNDVIKKLKEAL